MPYLAECWRFHAAIFVCRGLYQCSPVYLRDTFKYITTVTSHVGPIQVWNTMNASLCCRKFTLTWLISICLSINVLLVSVACHTMNIFKKTWFFWGKLHQTTVSIHNIQYYTASWATWVTTHTTMCLDQQLAKSVRHNGWLSSWIGYVKWTQVRNINPARMHQRGSVHSW